RSGPELPIFEWCAPVLIAIIAAPVAQILAIFLARFAQIALLLAHVAGVAVTYGLTYVALLFADLLAVAAKLTGLCLRRRGCHHRDNQAGGEKFHLRHNA